MKPINTTITKSTSTSSDLSSMLLRVEETRYGAGSSAVFTAIGTPKKGVETPKATQSSSPAPIGR